jgi:hypothetical protein
VIFLIISIGSISLAGNKEMFQLKYNYKPGDEIFYKGNIEIRVTENNIPATSYILAVPFIIGMKVLMVNPDDSISVYVRIQTMFEKLKTYGNKKVKSDDVYTILYTSGFLPEGFVVARLTREGDPYYVTKVCGDTVSATLPPEPLALGQKIQKVKSLPNGTLIKFSWTLKDIKVKKGHRIALLNLEREIKKENYNYSLRIENNLDMEFDMDLSTVISVSGISDIVVEKMQGDTVEQQSRYVMKIGYKMLDAKNIDCYTKWGEVPDVFLKTGVRWTVGYAPPSRRINTMFIEYVPEGESVENWSEMLSVGISAKPQQGIVRPEDILKNMLGSLPERCPDARYEILENNPDDLLYECFFPEECMREKFNFPERDFGRIIIGKDRIHVVIYATKEVSLSQEQKAEALDFLKEIKLSNSNTERR